MTKAETIVNRTDMAWLPLQGRRSRVSDTGVLLLMWLALSSALLVFAFPTIVALKATDPDDYMRLAEVRDWLAGQSWFDVRQHRMGPPPGADMHWSRLVDIPIAAVAWLAGRVVAEPAASGATMAVVPLFELLVAMLLLRRLVLALGAARSTALAAAALPLLFPVLTSNFMPMRIDHHAWQGICALACSLALRRPGPAGCAIGGLIAAIWLTISLEGLVLVFAIAALLAWRTFRDGEPALSPFAGALAVGGAAATMITHPLGDLAVAHADQLGWPQLAAFAAAAVISAAAGFRTFATRPRRFATLGLAAVAGAALLLAGLGASAVDPFHGMPPVVRGMWLENIPEGLPITHQDWQTTAMLLWTPLLVIAGWRIVRQSDPGARAWNEQAAIALAACALSLLLMRGALAAQLLTVPFSAVLLSRLFPRAASLRHALIRVPAMLGCLTLLTPSLASAAGRLADHYSGSSSPARFHRQLPAAPAACDLASLASLPPAHILAPLDLGPEILVRTSHSVVAGSYHRNYGPMRDVIEAFSGDPVAAPAIARANHATVLVFCPGSAEAGIYTSRRSDNLANALVNGRPPRWLSPLPGFGGLQAYRVIDR